MSTFVDVEKERNKNRMYLDAALDYRAVLIWIRNELNDKVDTEHIINEIDRVIESTKGKLK